MAEDIHEGDIWEDGSPVTPLDLRESSALSNLKLNDTVGLIPRNMDTVFHRHAEAEDIFEVLALICHDGNTLTQGPRDWSTVASDLNDEFPGLNCSSTEVRSFCLKTIAPIMVIPKSQALRSIIEKGQSLDMLGKLMESSEAAGEGVKKAIETLQQFEEGKDGRLTRTGASITELASILRAKGKLDESLIKEMERYGLIPESKKAPDTAVQVNVDLRGVMDKARGH